VESIKWAIIRLIRTELNRLGVHFILSVFIVNFVPCSLSRCSFSEIGYLIYVRVVMSIAYISVLPIITTQFARA